MKEKCMKNGEIYHIWANFGDLYRYTFEPVPVQPSRTEPVPVQVRAVPVQMAPAAPVFVIFAYLS